MPSIIELNNISKHYGSVIGVDEVNLSVEDGEFLTLLGPSGCGKSTLLRMIGGFETPTSGTITLAGEDVTHRPPQDRDVNMMFQDYALFPHMSVGENIAYGLKRKGINRKEAKERSQEALELVGLPDKIHQKPNQLSGGQRQRIALARAIVRQPKVLLLDEPLSALDAKMREQMQVELKHMHDKLGITFIMVTHDQAEALVMSDRIIVMEKGNIAQDGGPEDLYERPENPYVANFIGTTNFLDASILSAEADQSVLMIDGSAIRLPRPLPDGASESSTASLQLGIRPEKARLLRASTTRPDNAIPATVEETIYLGLSIRTVVKTYTGSIILVDQMLQETGSANSKFQPGEAVYAVIDPQNALLFEGGHRK